MNAKITANSFEEEFFNRLKTVDVWKRLSGSHEFPITLEILEKYQDNWDWEEISGNNNIYWTAEMIEKFKTKIKWRSFSLTYARADQFNFEILRKFQHYFDWVEVSRGICFVSEETLEEFASKWDWKELIDNRYINWDYILFNKFKHYINVMEIADFKRTVLWDNLIEIDERILIGKILSN